MKVVHICTGMLGGAGKAALRIHKSVSARGTQSSMLVLRKDIDEPNLFLYKPQQSFVYEAKRKFFSWKLHWCSRAFSPACMKFSDDRLGFDLSSHPLIQEADIIHLHWISEFVHFTKFFKAMRAKPIIWTLHDCYPFLGGWHLATDYQRFLAHRTDMRLLLHHWTMRYWSHGIKHRKKKSYRRQRLHLVAPSRWMLRQVAHNTLLSERPISLIPHGVETDIFRPYNKEQVRYEFGFPSKKTIFLFCVAFSSPNKGECFLWETLKLLSEQRDLSDSALIVISDNPIWKRKKLGFEVRALERIPDKNKLARCISASDFLIISSFEESFSLMALESMSCGVPLVASSVGAIPDLVDHECNGLLCRKGSTKDFIANIQWMLDHPHERNSMGNQARKKILKEYSMDMLGRYYNDLYKTAYEMPIVDGYSQKNLPSLHAL